MQETNVRQQPSPNQSEPSGKRRVHYGAIIVLLLLVTWLGARSLNADALWYDEVWSLYYAGGQEYGPISPAETVNRIIDQLQFERNPPGYYLLLNLWGSAVGWSEYAGRVLSLLAGVLAVGCIYRLGYDLGTPPDARSRHLVGLGASVAVGGSAFLIYYLHELRVYSLMMLFSTLVLSTYWRLQYQRRQPSIWLQIVFVLSIVGALYLHFMTALMIGALGLYHLFIVRKNGRWLRVAILGITGGILFLPWLPSLFRGATETGGLRLSAMNTPAMLREVFVVFSNVSVLMLVLCVMYAVMGRGRLAKFVWFMLLTSVGLAAAINFIYPVVTHIRYLIALWPTLALVVGVGIEQLARRGVSPALLLGLWLAAGVWNTVDPSFNRALSDSIPLPWREFRAELEQHGEADDVVAFHAPDFNWFRDLEIQHYMFGLPMRYSLMENIQGLQADDEYYDHAGAFVNGAPRVWVGIDKTFAPNFRLGEFQRILSENYAPCYNVFDVPDMRFDLYTRVPGADEMMLLEFSEGVGVKLLEPIRTLPGGKVSALLGWRVGTNVPPETYSVGLHMVDSAGNIAAQVDMGLPPAGYHCQQAEFDLPPGDYEILALLYNWQSGERVAGVNSETGETGDRLRVGMVAAE
jgi:hypothetical protein